MSSVLAALALSCFHPQVCHHVSAHHGDQKQMKKHALSRPALPSAVLSSTPSRRNLALVHSSNFVAPAYV
eukprot:CAMPEP_0179435074 /NCGR_PEP_ID=MMETSP0799-20121207/19268_1 /TAXON_ID=46947 /ORGANISM="Geminigera cryophila, Strain CCMP2564" /LENGTH=69 /DNA_ID=CAMNT_0021214249 /DNA_START=1761 /DNA_END=1970 /DNA_ORIENTATION=+